MPTVAPWATKTSSVTPQLSKAARMARRERIKDMSLLGRVSSPLDQHMYTDFPMVHWSAVFYKSGRSVRQL